MADGEINLCSPRFPLSPRTRSPPHFLPPTDPNTLFKGAADGGRLFVITSGTSGGRGGRDKATGGGGKIKKSAADNHRDNRPIGGRARGSGHEEHAGGGRRSGRGRGGSRHQGAHQEVERAATEARSGGKAAKREAAPESVGDLDAQLESYLSSKKGAASSTSAPAAASAGLLQEAPTGKKGGKRGKEAPSLAGLDCDLDSYFAAGKKADAAVGDAAASAASAAAATAPPAPVEPEVAGPA